MTRKNFMWCVMLISVGSKEESTQNVFRTPLLQFDFSNVKLFTNSKYTLKRTVELNQNSLRGVRFNSVV